jgi:hypothetical protein
MRCIVLLCVGGKKALNPEPVFPAAYLMILLYPLFCDSHTLSSRD